jgi:hypothetical protein
MVAPFLSRPAFHFFFASVVAFTACSDDGADPSDGGGGETGVGGDSTGGAPAGGAPGVGGNGEGGAEPEGPALPTYFRMLATAEGTEGGVNVGCSIDFIFELDEGQLVITDESAEAPGTHGGDAARSLLDDEGAGFVFNASAAGEVIATLVFPDQLALSLPGNETATNAFWQELALFEGTLAADGTANGTWTCAPLEIEQDGYVDDTIYVEGTWEIELLE